MNAANLTTYLNDHLAGSVAALELLARLAGAFEGTEEAPLITELRQEVEADQTRLRELLKRLAVDESTLKKAGAWMAEKISAVKLHSSADGVGVLESLEMLVLGIEGKLRLWRSLEVVDLGLNLPQLEAAAAAQIAKVESLRMLAARKALV